MVFLMLLNLFLSFTSFFGRVGLPFWELGVLTCRKNDFAWYDGHRSIDSFLKYLPPPQSNYLNYSLNPELNSTSCTVEETSNNHTFPENPLDRFEMILSYSNQIKH